MSGDAAEAQRARAANGSGGGGGGSSNRIQVSNTKKPLFFYVNLAKRYMQQHGEVELSALGMAIATVVTVAEILKNNGFAFETRIRTSTVEIKDEMRGRPIQKDIIQILFFLPQHSSPGNIYVECFAQIEIVLRKSDKFDELMATAAEEAAEDEEEQT
ncbi:unnamed protein product [Triticum turgidum subsp. durum]|uniref:DNA/RNA-binding protein Alba-like domain-containing protein n=1 Tax=Triticum turgidum subsp. durum TaxID=4567 RepID=A0A9R0Q0X1_TRITD|nr:unnamed protein product [Triticum turgidum subsp. durum]